MTTADLSRQKVDRDEVFIEYTKSICPGLQGRRRRAR